MNITSLGGLFSKFVRKTSHVQNKLVPGWNVNRIENLLFAPQNRNKVIGRAPKGFKEETVQTTDGGVHTISIGSGPTVVLVHGWGGSSLQFIPLMRGLARCGFNAIAFDHIGYGQSYSKPTTLQQSIKTTNEILHYVRKNANDGLAAIVGHSTGCISVVNVRTTLLNEIPLFLISPVFNYKLFYLKQMVKLKLRSEVVKQYAANFGKTYKQNYEKLELARHLVKYADTAVIAHDESDTESAAGDSVKFCQKNPLTRLLVTKKFDHNRLIISESVWQELKSTLNYDDTTINFSEVVFQR